MCSPSSRESFCFTVKDLSVEAADEIYCELDCTQFLFVLSLWSTNTKNTLVLLQGLFCHCKVPQWL